MRTSIPAALLFAMTALACASAQPKQSTAPVPVAISAAALEEHPGESFAEAVVVPPHSPNEGVNFQNEWIYKRFGVFRRQSSGMMARDGRHFDVVSIETRDRTLHTVYFDTTDMWNALYPPK